MAKSVFIDQLSKFIDKSVEIKGWVQNKRSSGSILFLQIRDGYGTVQAVVSKNDISEELFDQLNKITIESSVSITGNVKKEERSPTGVELLATDGNIICLSPDDYPIQKKRDGSKHSIQFLFNNRHLHLRTERQWAIQRIRNCIINSVFQFLSENRFVKIDSPILTPNACEGTTTLFKVPYTPAWNENETDGVNMFLTQSGQLYLEAAIMSLNRVFDFGPVFRAEKSKTRRHLTEFWMMDAEMAFFDHKQNMKLQEDLTKYIISNVLEKSQEELSILNRDSEKLKACLNTEYPVITHKKAVEILQKLGSDIKERDDLGADDETILTRQYETPIFIEKYPKEVKAFYMKDDPNDNSRVLNADMLAPEGYGEVIGGSQREDNYDTLMEKITKEDLNMEDFKWYLDLRKYGSVPHSGFGIGLERYVTWICGVKHIRETIPFPRTIKRIKP